jgi:hypothetical protein
MLIHFKKYVDYRETKKKQKDNHIYVKILFSFILKYFFKNEH